LALASFGSLPLAKQLSSFMAGCALALLSRRTLIIPEFSCRNHPEIAARRDACSVDMYFKLQPLLELNRALVGAVGYTGKPDSISEDCPACNVFMGTKMFESAGGEALPQQPRTLPWKKVLEDKSMSPIIEIEGFPTIYELLLGVSEMERKNLKQLFRLYFVPLKLDWREGTFPVI
jgi:hypothetical protein